MIEVSGHCRPNCTLKPSSLKTKPCSLENLVSGEFAARALTLTLTGHGNYFTTLDKAQGTVKVWSREDRTVLPVGVLRSSLRSFRCGKETATSGISPTKSRQIHLDFPE